MNPRVNYEMTQEDLDVIMQACKPVACMMIGGRSPSSPQENANRAWAVLGKKMGFDSMTVNPSVKGDRYFTAVPSETDHQRESRIVAEKLERTRTEISELEADIAEKQSKLEELKQGEVK